MFKTLLGQLLILSQLLTLQTTLGYLGRNLTIKIPHLLPTRLKYLLSRLSISPPLHSLPTKLTRTLSLTGTRLSTLHPNSVPLSLHTLPTLLLKLLRSQQFQLTALTSLLSNRLTALTLLMFLTLRGSM